MINRTIVKAGAAVLLLAVVLIVLGVNFVPQIYARSPSRQTSLETAKLPRADFVDERYPRAIVPQLSLAGSDWIERHPTNYFTGSDWIERHPVQP